MCHILNTLIAIGGTTAHQMPFENDRMLNHYVSPPGLISSTVAELDGSVVGFQCLVWPNADQEPFPPGWALIATFVHSGLSRQGIGSALFAETKARAKAAGVKTIDATIRADNISGLAFYGRMQFRDYAHLKEIPLRDGTRVDRVRKRFDLN